MDVERDRTDKPSWGMAIVGAAAASVVFGGSMGPRARAVEDVPGAPVATASAASTSCARTGSTPNVAPAVPPAGPSDAQINASGTSAAGGAGTVAGDVRGDPCEPAKRFEHARGAASAAARTTPTTLNRR